MSLEIRNISFSFPGSRSKTLSRISFTVNQGESLGIAGKSGSGKTTLLRAVYGLYDLASGAVFFQGEKVRGPAQELIPGHPEMKMIAQHFDLLADHSVEENILHRLMGYKPEFKQKKTEQLLGLSGLKKVRKHKPAALSGGQKQLLAISCALAVEPKLLLLDEPFSQLDVSTKNEMYAYISRLKKMLGFTLILVSHDAQDVLGICDRILIMDNGKVVESGTPEELYFQPRFEYTAALFGTYSVVKTGKKERYIRPGKIHPTTSAHARFSGNVTEIHFRGTHYEISVLDDKKQQKLIFAASENRYRSGQRLHLNY